MKAHTFFKCKVDICFIHELENKKQMYKKMYWNMLGREYIDHVHRLNVSAYLGGSHGNKNSDNWKTSFYGDISREQNCYIQLSGLSEKNIAMVECSGCLPCSHFEDLPS